MRLGSIQPAVAVQGASVSPCDFRAAHILLYVFLAAAPWLNFFSYKVDTFALIGDVRISAIGGVKDVLVAAFGATVVWSNIHHRGRPQLVWNLWTFALAGLIVIAIVSVTLHRSTFSLYLARTYLLPFALLLLVAVTGVTTRVVRNALLIMIVNGLAFSAIALAEYGFSVDSLLIGDPWEVQLYNRVSSIFEGPNTFASHLMFPLAASIAFALSWPRRSVRLLSLSATLFLLVALFLTASRSGIIAAAFIVAVWACRRLRLYQLAVLLVVIAAIPISLLVFAKGYSWNLFYGIPEAAQLRFDIWQQILERRDKEVILSTGKDISVADPRRDWDPRRVRWGSNVLSDGSFEESRALNGEWEAAAGTPIVDRDLADFVGRGRFGYRVYSTAREPVVVVRSRRLIPVDTLNPYLVVGSFRRWWYPPAQSAIRVVCYDVFERELGIVHPNRPVRHIQYAGEQFLPAPRFTRYGGAVVGQSGIDGTADGGFIRDTAYIRVELALNWGTASGVVADALVLRRGTIPGREPIVTTSNSYLRLLVDYGVAGLVLYAILVAGLLAILIREDRDVSVLALSVLMAYLAIAFFHDILVAHPQMLFLAVLAGFALNPWLREEDRALHRGQTRGAPTASA
jgi:hypothetical protein